MTRANFRLMAALAERKVEGIGWSFISSFVSLKLKKGYIIYRFSKYFIIDKNVSNYIFLIWVFVLAIWTVTGTTEKKISGTTIRETEIQKLKHVKSDCFKLFSFWRMWTFLPLFCSKNKNLEVSVFLWWEMISVTCCLIILSFYESNFPLPWNAYIHFTS